MTRINLIPPEQLHYKHLVAEYREITRIPSLVRKNGNRPFTAPNVYVLGTGHVKFFYSRLGFIADRYEQLCNEMRRRGYVCNQIIRAELLKDINNKYIQAYTPTEEAIMLNRQRIAERMPK